MAQVASRSSWKGSLSFGLVSMPIRLHVAADERGVRFNMLHAADGHRIRQRKFCEGCDAEVGMDEIVKGFPVDRETYVQVTKDELDALPVATKKMLTVTSFVDEGSIDPVMFSGKSYYIQPEEAGARGYATMQAAMQRLGRAGVARIAFRESKEHLALVRAREDTLIVDILFWPDEVRSVSDAGYEATPAKGEVAMAEQLVDAMTATFDPAEHVDGYRDAVMELVEAKANNLPAPADVPIPKAPVVDFTASLKASVEAVKKGRGARASKPGTKRTRKAS